MHIPQLLLRSCQTLRSASALLLLTVLAALMLGKHALSDEPSFGRTSHLVLQLLAACWG